MDHIELTDGNGTLLPMAEVFTHPDEEPLPSSIVMTEGNYGNAWQRHGHDGLWHSTTGARRRWSQMLRMRNLVLVYDAPEREPRCGHEGCGIQHRHEHVPVTTWDETGTRKITRY